MPLTSSVKEIGAILQKLIKFEPGQIQVIHNDEKHLNGVDGDADALGPGVFGVGLGAANEKQKSETNLFSHKNCINKEKKAVLISVWLKESY